MASRETENPERAVVRAPLVMGSSLLLNGYGFAPGSLDLEKVLLSLECRSSNPCDRVRVWKPMISSRLSLLTKKTRHEVCPRSLLILITHLLSTYCVLGTVLGLLSAGNRIKLLTCIKLSRARLSGLCLPIFQRRDLWQAEKGEAICLRSSSLDPRRLQTRLSLDFLSGSQCSGGTWPSWAGIHTWPCSLRS